MRKIKDDILLALRCNEQGVDKDEVVRFILNRVENTHIFFQPFSFWLGITTAALVAILYGYVV